MYAFDMLYGDFVVCKNGYGEKKKKRRRNWATRESKEVGLNFLR